MKNKRIGIFGWGLVAPQAPDIRRFEANLRKGEAGLTPFEGFGPAHFLVGRPEFDFAVYKNWVDQRFEPRKFAQLDGKMGDSVKYALGGFIQALEQNQGMESLLRELGDRAHVYVGTGLGEMPVQYEITLAHYRAQRLWDRFWCQAEFHPLLAGYEGLSEEEKGAVRERYGAPVDPAGLDWRQAGEDEAQYNWFHFWARHSQGLHRFLAELREIEAEGLTGDIESQKGHLIKRKMVGRKRLLAKHGCPEPPWMAIDAKILWNIANIPAAQISMLGRITGPVIAPVAACAGFGASLRLGINAIQLGQASLCVVGTTDPAPHVLSVGGFFGARVVSGDGQVSKPFTQMRGTHVSGGSCIWIIGDYDEMIGRGMHPVGLEILGVGITSDADHIITPSDDGPRRAIQKTLAEAGLLPGDVRSWDMHATATPGDHQELLNALSLLSPETLFTARKGSFGHGMSACGGWELTAQHLGVQAGCLFPVAVQEGELPAWVKETGAHLVLDEGASFQDGACGKINMGVGGVNACTISRPWPRQE